MTSWYVRATNGSDAGAGTSHADAFQTIQKAIDDSAGGDQINLNDEAAFVLAAELNWTGFGVGTSQDAPLIIRGYTAVENDGGIGDIDGNDAIATIFAATSKPGFVTLGDLKLHSTTGVTVVGLLTWHMLNCEVLDGSGARLVQTFKNVIGCHVHDDGGTSVDGVYTGGGNIIGNTIHGMSGKTIEGIASSVIGNLCYDIDESGYDLPGDYGLVLWNTFDGKSISGVHGIDLSFSNSESITILGNLITNWGTGGSGGAIRWVAGTNTLLIGHNHFFNNSEGNKIGEVTLGLDLGNDATADPEYVNAAAGDYTPGAPAQGWPFVMPGGLVTNYGAIGAIQPANAGGGAKTLLRGVA